MSRRPERFFPLRYKLLVSYILLALIPVLAIGSYSYYYTMHSIEERTKDNLKVALGQFSNSVQIRMSDIIRSSDAIFDDQVLSRYLSGYILGYERHQIMTTYVLPKLDMATALPNVQVMLDVYLDRPSVDEYYYDAKEKFLRDGQRQFGIRYTERIQDEPWYLEMKDLAYDSIVWQQIGNDKEFQNISLVRPLIDYERIGKIGLIKVTVKLKDIFEDYDFSAFGEEMKLVVVDENNKLLYTSSMPEDEYQESMLVQAEASGDMLLESPLGIMNARIAVLVPLESMHKESFHMRNTVIWICLSSMLVAILISIFTSKVFTLRFGKLVHSLQAFKEGDLQRRIKYRGNDEFSQISEAFNDMASTIQSQINEIYISKLEKKEAELQILHAQINPHFLYNTFSSISRMAKLGELEKLHEIIRSLAKFYRMTLNRGEMFIPIGKEIEIIESYLSIQNIKYADRIIVRFDIDESLLEFKTVKFVLQPFVENVLEHAWYDDQIEIDVAVFAESEGEIVMEVRDNGLGMKEETIAAIFSESGNGIGYGIRNVEQRIKLHFGQSYGVVIRSMIGHGTAVQLRIPAVSEMEKAGGESD